MILQKLRNLKKWFESVEKKLNSQPTYKTKINGYQII